MVHEMRFALGIIFSELFISMVLTFLKINKTLSLFKRWSVCSFQNIFSKTAPLPRSTEFDIRILPSRKGSLFYTRMRETVGYELRFSNFVVAPRVSNNSCE